LTIRIFSISAICTKWDRSFHYHGFTNYLFGFSSCWKLRVFLTSRTKNIQSYDLSKQYDCGKSPRQLLHTLSAISFHPEVQALRQLGLDQRILFLGCPISIEFLISANQIICFPSYLVIFIQLKILRLYLNQNPLISTSTGVEKPKRDGALRLILKSWTWDMSFS